jgi:hypothetical protein
LAAQEAFNAAVETWSDSRLKAYLDARGVPVPQASRTDELRALVRRNSHKAASGFNAWSWDDLSYQNLKNYLVNSGDSAAKKIGESASATREDLVEAAQSAYASASRSGGNSYASATSYLSQATQAAKNNIFDTWSESELKSYLDSYGVVRITPFQVSRISTDKPLSRFPRVLLSTNLRPRPGSSLLTSSTAPPALWALRLPRLVRVLRALTNG